MDIKNKLDDYLNSHLYVMKEASVIHSRSANIDFTGANINTYINNNKDDNTFQKKLFKLIDDRNLKDSDVYNKVDIDRRLFSKIRSNTDYHPSKETIILFGIALELDELEIEDLLKSASYSLPMNSTFDLIIRFCFKEKIYNINTINEFLYDHGCKLLNQ